MAAFRRTSKTALETQATRRSDAPVSFTQGDRRVVHHGKLVRGPL